MATTPLWRVDAPRDPTFGGGKEYRQDLGPAVRLVDVPLSFIFWSEEEAAEKVQSLGAPPKRSKKLEFPDPANDTMDEEVPASRDEDEMDGAQESGANDVSIYNSVGSEDPTP